MSKFLALFVLVISSYISFANNNTNTNFKNEMYSKLNSQVGKAISNKPITQENIEYLCKYYIQSNCPEIDTANLKLIVAFNKTNQWFVHFAQTYKGIELTNGRIKIRLFQDGKLLDIEPNIYKNVSAELVSNIDSNQMKLAVVSMLDGEHNINEFNFKFQGNKIFTQNGKTFREVEAIEFSNEINTICYGVYIDRQTNEILFKKNLVMNEGVIAKAMIYDSPFVPMVENTKFPYLKAVVQSGNIFADAEGVFTPPINLYGEIATIDFSNYHGNTPPTDRKRPYLTMTVREIVPETNKYTNYTDTTKHFYVDNEILLTAANTREDSILTFKATHYFHIFKMDEGFKKIDAAFNYLSRGFSFTFLIYNTQDPNYINYSNASSSGEGITFYNIFTKSMPFVTSPGTLYHELGHSINKFLYQDCGSSYGMYDGSLNEGSADVHAAYIRNSSEMDFMPSRTLENNLRLLYDEKNEVHDDGRIFSGAMWDLKKLTSLELMGHLLHYTRFAIPDGNNCREAYTNWLKEMLITDDDDGNLANFTPHFDEIIEAFNKHNITLAFYTQLNYSHTQLDDTKDTINSYPLELTIPFVNRFVSKSFDSVWVCYSINYTAQAPILLTRQNDKYYGNIPAQHKGSLVQYYFVAADPYKEYTHYYLTQYSGKLYSFIVNFDTTYKNTGMQEPLKNTSENDLVWRSDNPATQSDTIRAFAPNYDFGDNTCWMITDHPKQQTHLKTATIIFPDVKISDKQISAIQLYYFYYISVFDYEGKIGGTLDIAITKNSGKSWLDVVNLMPSPYMTDWAKLNIDIKDYYSSYDSIGLRVRVACGTDYSDYKSYIRFAAYIDDISFLSGSEHTSIKENTFTNSMLSPNPTNNFSMISFNSLVDGDIKIVLTNILGEHVKTIYDGYVETGDVSIAVDVSKLNKGIYFVYITQGTNISTQKLVVY